VFAQSTPTLLAGVAGKVKREQVAAGAAVMRQGDIGDKFYIVLSGRVDVEIEKDGARATVSHLGPGNFFGELALLHDQPRAATVRAAGPVDLLTLDKAQFLDVVNSSPTFEEQLKRIYFAR
jgi:CRP-like cAMP-binding protein